MPLFKPRLTFWQLWNMSLGFFGIQFGFALQNANTSRIFSTMGAKPDELPLFWLAAPITGLLVQPIIGYLSDNTWHARWGRRRPFFFLGAVLASIALFGMPNSAALWMAVIWLWIMDASINIAMEPFRAFVGDKLDTSQQTAGFAMQTFFIGCGAVIASLLPSFFVSVLHISNESVNGSIPDSVRYAFYAGGFVFFASVLWTVLTSDEIPPEDVATFKAGVKANGGIGNAIGEILGGFAKMPKTMVQLAVVQFLTWIGLFAMWIYTTSAVADKVFGVTDPQSPAYQDAGNWVGNMFAVYSGVSALAAFVLPRLAAVTGKRVTHFICLLLGGLGLAGIFLIRQKEMLVLPMIGIGIAWASILTMPYAILASALPPKKMGYYMGVFNFFIVIPQIVSGIVLGSVTKFVFAGDAAKTVALGGLCMVAAGLCALFVDEDQAAQQPAADAADAHRA